MLTCDTGKAPAAPGDRKEEDVTAEMMDLIKEWCDADPSLEFAAGDPPTITLSDADGLEMRLEAGSDGFALVTEAAEQQGVRVVRGALQQPAGNLDQPLRMARLELDQAQVVVGLPQVGVRLNRLAEVVPSAHTVLACKVAVCHGQAGAWPN